MTNVQKENIKTKLAAYCEKYDSQNKAANSLKDVSAGTISQVLNNKWEKISDDMWLNIGKQIGYTTKEWVIVKTKNFKEITGYLEDAAEYADVFGIIAEAGASKSVACKAFVENNKRAYRLQCNAYWNSRQFVTELISVIGRPYDGLNMHEMMVDIVKTVKTQQNPVIILDEFDKVNDQLLYFFITLYNQLEDQCGLVIVGTPYLKKRILRGLLLGKKGYREVFSRLGSRLIELPAVTDSCIQQVAMANGVLDEARLKETLKDCREHSTDLRRVKRKVNAMRRSGVIK